MGINDLFSKRMKHKRGEVPDIYSYSYFPKELKVKIVQIWDDALGDGVLPDFARRSRPSHRGSIYADALAILKKERGQFNLIPQSHVIFLRPKEQQPVLELVNYFLDLAEVDLTSVELALDVVELVFKEMHLFRVSERPDDTERVFHQLNGTRQSFSDAIEELNARFREHGVGYQFESGQIIRVDSTFTHSEIVKPTLQLLADEEFYGPNEEFLKAHEHYRHGNYPGCLVECLRAFESTMKIICDKRGWPYNKDKATAHALIKACLNGGLLPGFTEQQLTSTRTLLESGIPTTRNKLAGHGHGANPVSVPQHMASFGIHSTAINILLLAKADKALP